MGEKKSLKISLSTFLLMVSIVIIIIMGYYIYKTSSQNASLKEENNSLKAEIANLESSASSYKEKIDSIAKIINSNNTKTDKNEQSNSKKTENNNSEITKKLENDNLLLVNDSTKNNDGTYTLKGKIITIDNSKEQTTEYPNYKETGENKQITVDGKTKCRYLTDSNEEKTDTVENVFTKKLYSGAGQGPCFNFKFENGKCTEVYEVVTGH